MEQPDSQYDFLRPQVYGAAEGGERDLEGESTAIVNAKPETEWG